MPLEHYINIAVNGPFWVEVANPEHPFQAMLMSRSRGTCLIRVGNTHLHNLRVGAVKILGAAGRGQIVVAAVVLRDLVQERRAFLISPPRINLFITFMLHCRFAMAVPTPA